LHLALSLYNDEALFQMMKQDDEAAFTELYNRYWKRLLFVAGVKLRDLAIAEELVQDIFLDLWNRREQMELSGKLGHYLAVCMKHRVIDAQARRKRAEDYARFAADKPETVGDTPEHWLRFEELRDELARLVAGLPERCRITYQLSREEGLTQKEIAHRLQVTQKAVEGNLTRALKALRTGLAHLHLWF
jgi:RNA polymerase sigma-70 factor (family 1)